MNKLEGFKNYVDDVLDELETVIADSLKDGGDKSEDSQRIAFINALYKIRKLVNGTTEEDLV